MHAATSYNSTHMRALENAKVLYADPANCSRRFYYAKDDDTSTSWEGKVTDSHEFMDRTSSTSSGIPVYTGDASGFVAGLWHGDSSHNHQFLVLNAPPTVRPTSGSCTPRCWVYTT